MNNYNLLMPDPRPTRADAVKNREVLLDTAEMLFERDGVEAVTMTQIAQEAGVGKGTLYRHFNNKNEICQALLNQDMLDLQSRTLTQMRQNNETEATLRWFLEAVVRFVTKNEDLLFAGLDTSPDLSMEFPAHLWWRQTIRGCLRELIDDGDLEYLTDTLYILLDVHTLRFQHHSLGYDLQRIVDGLNDVLTRLLKP
ncbi:MAG: TetR/AcrR family transcriptional regulator [Aggregatilineales bacterium]